MGCRSLASTIWGGLHLEAVRIGGWRRKRRHDAAGRDLARVCFAVLPALVRHVAQPGAGGRTPSDLPLVALSQAEIERLEGSYPQIEDVLPLSPLQEGLLFHALFD